MPVDLSKLSTEDLVALKSGDLTKVSTDGLMMLKGEAPAPQTPSQSATPQRDVLKEAAPFYLGPAGTPRAARDILHGIDTATNYLSNRAGEGGTDVATSLGASPETAAKFGIASNIGVQALPAVLGGGLASKASPALEWAATKLMKSTLTKPTPNQILSGNADKAIQTMLEKGISPTVGGMSEVGVRVGKLENDISNILANSTAKVDKEAVITRAKDAWEKVKLETEHAKNLKELNDVIKNFRTNPEYAFNDLPIDLANKIKQTLYREISKTAYQPGQVLGTADLTKKHLARGMREEIAGAEPAVVEPLKKQSELINVLETFGSKVASEYRHLVGLGALAPTQAGVMTFIAERYPWLIGKISHALYSGSERIPGAMGAAGVIAEQQNKKEELSPPESRKMLMREKGLNGVRG